MMNVGAYLKHLGRGRGEFPPIGKLQKLMARFFSSGRVSREVSVTRQVFEICYLYFWRGFGPGYYFEAAMSRSDRDMAYKTGFYGRRGYLKRVKELNNPRYAKISQNKLSEAALLHALGIPSPKTLGHLSQKHGLDFRGRLLRTGADLACLLEEEAITRFCSKPVEGWNGYGFVGADVVRNGDIFLRLIDSGELLTCDDYVARFTGGAPEDNRIIQNFVVQHPIMAALNPSSVNTIRMMVFRPRDGASRAFGGIARIGRAGSLIDNVSAGGLWAFVDMSSGRLRSGNRLNADKNYYIHPDHGGAIDGVVVPYWEEARALACRMLDVFPETRFLGVDVAIGPDGPIIIEVNNQPDYLVFAHLEIPSCDILQD